MDDKIDVEIPDVLLAAVISGIERRERLDLEYNGMVPAYKGSLALTQRQRREYHGQEKQTKDS